MTLSSDSGGIGTYYGSVNIASYYATYGNPISVYATTAQGYPAIATIDNNMLKVSANYATVNATVVFAHNVNSI